ncbi:MAG TPA: YkvA family protein [Methylophilus sp.]
MRLSEKLKTIASKLKAEFDFYRRLQQHPRTPWLAKALLWLAIGYLLMPFDLIPDFLPVIGQLDEVVIIPLLLYCAIKLTPSEILAECRAAA